MAMAAASIAVAAPLRASASASPRASRSRAAAARPRVAAPRASPLAPRTRKGAAVRAAAAAADSSDATAKKKKKDPAAAGKKTGASATSAENADASAGSSSSSSSPSKNEKAKEALAAALRSGDAVVGRVEVANRGGLILRIFNGRYRAFLPLSQMASSRTAAIKGGKSKAAAQLKRVTAPLASFDDGAFYLTLVPIRPRSRGERRSLRTFPGVSLRPPLAFNPRPRRLSTPSDAFELHLDVRSYGPSTLRRRRRRLRAADAAAVAAETEREGRDRRRAGAARRDEHLRAGHRRQR